MTTPDAETRAEADARRVARELAAEREPIQSFTAHEIEQRVQDALRKKSDEETT